ARAREVRGPGRGPVLDHGDRDRAAARRDRGSGPRAARQGGAGPVGRGVRPGAVHGTEPVRVCRKLRAVPRRRDFRAGGVRMDEYAGGGCRVPADRPHVLRRRGFAAVTRAAGLRAAAAAAVCAAAVGLAAPAAAQPAAEPADAAKPVAPFSLEADALGVPAVGVPLDVRVRVGSPTMLEDVEVRISADPGLAVDAGGYALYAPSASPEEPAEWRITVVPVEEGAHRLRLFGEALVDGVPQVRSTVATIRVGADDGADGDAGGESAGADSAVR